VRALFERAMDVMRVDMCYLELTPDQARSIDRTGEVRASAPVHRHRR
jgi:hypothetical protein